MKRFAVFAVAAVFAVTMAACSSDSSTSSPAAGSTSSDASMGTTVTSTLQDFTITLDPTSVAAGEVTFDITNNGPSTHEFVIVASDEAPDALPVENGIVSEDALDVVDEQEDIAASTTATLTADLEAGSYIIICNIETHYEQGMHAGLTVT